LNFRVEKFGAEFDKSDWWPIVYGRAWTTLTDSTNFPYNVYLTLHTIDPVTGEEIERGRFQNAYFKLSSDRPGILDNSQERILATLGYSIANVRSKATEAVGISTDNLVFRPLIRPVERQLERRLGLDVVRLSSRFTRNFLVANFNTNHNPVTTLDPTAPPETRRENPALAMLQSTRLLIGKYLWNDLYVNYIGQVEVGSDHTVASNLEAHPFIGLGLRHTLGLEYRINPAMHLQFEYDYNPLLMHNKEDRKIWLRHSFPVDFSGKSQ
ncbi:MAG: translocation/assembly module TamB domain-containing protein, partial [candidate division KSB1 bacterium]|nr:translocation/assembly module TamB domain-containing protein [candidate division KSB1 bacterium]